MFGSLVVCYLFLGGMGAGACLVLAVMGLLSPARLIGVRLASSGRPRLEPSASYRALFAPGYGVALAALAIGILCLLADLGRADRVLTLLLHPSATHIAVGAYALLVTLLLAVGCFLAWSGIVVRVPLAALRALQALSLASALVAMAYTGLLLGSLRSVPLWNTPWLVALFALSALSCGCALVLAAMQASGSALAFRRAVRRLACVDLAVIACEGLAAVLFALTAPGALWGGAPKNSTDDAAAAALQAMLAGPDAWLFWGGFVLAGLVAAFALETGLARSRKPRPLLGWAVAGCVLAGGLALRYCMVAAGMQPVVSTLGGI